MMTNNSLENIISRIIVECNQMAIEKMIYLLEESLVTEQTTAYEWARLLEPYRIPAPLLSDFKVAFSLYDCSIDTLIFGLRTSLQIKSKIGSTAPSIEFVWTGPFPPSTGNVRSTMSVMQEMLSNAISSVFLVGYSFTNSSAFTQAIIHQLAQAMKRGCEVKIALHDAGYNYYNLKQAWPIHLPLPILLKWEGIKGDDKASLHAKLLLVNQSDLFVTSANLTHHGLSSNIEVGVRIKKSNIAKQLVHHFNSLERSGILQRI
ncbi:phosphatidylserine/phosphatidylglycerophosphate/cardiolipin synthase-like enzyme [Paenibacillus sp. V4I3]|uniref:phospholipase D-like domain-containing protein n=1 Tax=Paenibacillus sp. V4I3 TaxID=3042305 RepID=UPI0027881AC3|nr:phospholipase D-like domain-containing protein [Paenibacillus sp. V4I3]MDQ0878978.1 phosphatidylserine/phosphatidylglycerophosphate/cardiolipin synthase-like enzyme [Paenibacillus sp. V4I3]